MDKKRLQHLAQQLQVRRQELRRSVTQKQEYGRGVDGEASPDIIEGAATTYSKELLFRQSTDERRMLQMLEQD